jgi:hypothetical protein
VSRLGGSRSTRAACGYFIRRMRRFKRRAAKAVQVRTLAGIRLGLPTCLPAWLAGWLAGCLAGWLAGCLRTFIGAERPGPASPEWPYLRARFRSQSAGRQVGWLVGRQVGWLVGR